jgi:hypothetical protein
LRMQWSSLDDGPVVYRRDDKRVIARPPAQEFANARSAIRCAVVLIPFGGAADKIKKPRRVAGAGP